MTSRPQFESDQLQFICRQLRYDTRGLGMTRNDFHFENYAEAAMFIRCLPPAMYSCLRVLHIHDGDFEVQFSSWQKGASPVVRTVKDLCAKYPHITVRVHRSAL